MNHKFLLGDYMLIVLTSFLSVWNHHSLEKSKDHSDASRILASTASMILWIVRICEVVDRFL